MSALSDCYARPSTPFGQLGPFYDALGHRGKDYDRGARQTILAYDEMIIESTPAWSSGLGWTVGLRRLNIGGFAGFAHVYNLQGGIGTRIPKGGVIGYVAGWGDRPGSLWDGPHIHTTESQVSAYYAAVGIRPLADPGPAIARASAATLAGGVVIKIGDSTMETVVVAPNGNCVHLGPGVKRNFKHPEDYRIYRDTIAFLREKGASNLMLLPKLEDVPKVDWSTFGRLCEYVGVDPKA